MFRSADVVIVGAGVTGLATAICLRELGVGKVHVLERHYIGAAQSGRAAVVVRALVPHPRLAAWQIESQRFLASFSERYSIPIDVHQTGYLLVAQRHDQVPVLRAIEVARQAGAETRQICGNEALELQPGIRQGDNCIYAFEPGAIHVDPMPLTYALAVAARCRGVEISEGCDV